MNIEFFLAGQQELEATGEAGASKRKTLEDLFRPPIDLLHKGTFETVNTSVGQLLHFPFIFFSLSIFFKFSLELFFRLKQVANSSLNGY